MSDEDCSDSDDSIVGDWEPFDEEGDCTFCYYCLDRPVGGVLYYCDDDCGRALHQECCKKFHRERGDKKFVYPLDSKEWVCHYCKRDVKGLYKDPVEEFKSLCRRLDSEEKAARKEKLKRKAPAADLPQAPAKKKLKN